jgi:hypothetical protein
MVVGTWTGLARAGVHRPIGPFPDHGIIMVLGFLGTVIALERAVALRRRWPYVAPTLAGLSTLWLLGGLPRIGAAVLLTAAGLLVVAAEVSILRVRVEAHHVLMGLGAVAWVAAAALWGGGSTPVRLTPLLAAFLVLTIVGERLELSRLTLPGAASRRRFLAAVGLFVAGGGARRAGPSGRARDRRPRVARSGRLARPLRRGAPHDPSSRPAPVRGHVPARWLRLARGQRGAVGRDRARGAGAAAARRPRARAVPRLRAVHGDGPRTDRGPAVLRVPMHFLRAAYAPLVLLHVSVALRVGADLAGSPGVREVAMHGNIAALFLFVAVAVLATRRGRASLQAVTGGPA